MSANASIEIKPVISYPRTAAVGKSYVMTVDLCQASLEDQWPYEAEEYTIHLMLDSHPLFASEPIGDASVVLHRFGGTYGPATFLLVANKEEMQGNMRLTLVNEWGLPVDVIEIPGIRVTAEVQTGTTKSVRMMRETVAAPPERPLTINDPVSDVGWKPIVDPPRGFRLRHVLTEQDYLPTGQVAWSPDGKILAIPSKDLHLRDAETGRLLRSIHHEGSDDRLFGPVSFSPDGKRLAVHPGDFGIEIFDTNTFARLMKVKRHRSDILSFAWSPDGKTLGSLSADSHLKFCNAETGDSLLEHAEPGALTIAWSLAEERRFAMGTGSEVYIVTISDHALLMGLPLVIHDGPVYAVAWSPDGKLLASGGDDRAIQLSEPHTDSPIAVLDGHQDCVMNLSFSADSRLLASESADGVVKIWRCDIWELVAQLDEHSVGTRVFYPAFHPSQPVLATVDNDQRLVRIWELDVDLLLGSSRASEATDIYSTAKVVLLGDSGTGKSALAQRLTAGAFASTSSTHGYHIQLMKSYTVTEAEITVERDIMLWDLAGQANYRLLHSQHLADASVAVIVFDAHHHFDPFASVRFWDSVVWQTQSHYRVAIKKILVGARLDIAPGPQRRSVESLVRELNFDMYFETSAFTGAGIDDLAEAIEKLIDWKELPRIVGPLLTKYVRHFVLKEREAGTTMVTADDFYQSFLSSPLKEDYDLMMQPVTDNSELRPQFDVCIRNLEDHGLLMRLGDYILLRFELIDSYASAIINAARNDSNGFGAIREEDVLQCRFAIPADERLRNNDDELVVIKAAIDAFLRNEFMLLKKLNGYSMLVFPSEITVAKTDFQDRRDEAVRFHFDGVIQTIWTTLCIRLLKNDLFSNAGMWRNAITWHSTDGTCSLVLEQITPSQGQLKIYYDDVHDSSTKSVFEKFVHDQLLDLAIKDTVRSQDVIVCFVCHERLNDELTQPRPDRKYPWVFCPVCGNKIAMPKPLKIYVSSPFAGLQEYRQTVLEALRELGHDTVFAEVSNAVQSSSFTWMRQTIAECDVYICLLAWYRGYVSDLKDGRSVVQIEYETARERNKLILVLLRDPMTDPAQYESTGGLEDFRQQLSKEQHCEYFTTKKDLAEKVSRMMAELSQTKDNET